MRRGWQSIGRRGFGGMLLRRRRREGVHGGGEGMVGVGMGDMREGFGPVVVMVVMVEEAAAATEAVGVVMEEADVECGLMLYVFYVE